jgi:type IV pilus assembly protein PilB
MSTELLRSLVRSGHVTDDQVAAAHKAASIMGTTVADALVQLGYIEGLTFRRGFVELERREIPQTVIEWVPSVVARENNIIPIDVEDDVLVVAVSTPMPIEVLIQLRFVLDRDIKVAIASPEAIQAAIIRHYGEKDELVID